MIVMESLSAPGRGVRRRRLLKGDLVGRAAEATASGMGTPGFLIGLTVFIIIWVTLHLTVGIDSRGPLFVLNLLFSVLASYAAPLILLAQNREVARDNARTAVERANLRQYRTDMGYIVGQFGRVATDLDELATRQEAREAISDELAAFGAALRARSPRNRGAANASGRAASPSSP